MKAREWNKLRTKLLSQGYSREGTHLYRVMLRAQKAWEALHEMEREFSSAWSFTPYAARREAYQIMGLDMPEESITADASDAFRGFGI